jgi:hypothetical protein
VSKFTYNDIVRISADVRHGYGPRRKAWVVGIHDARAEPRFGIFPAGLVYIVEYEDGTSVTIQEDHLEAWNDALD